LGFEEGGEVGCWLGFEDGDEISLFVDEEMITGSLGVGIIVGFALGFKVGFRVGGLVGFTLGFKVGFRVGGLVGCFDGFGVGYRVGGLVGCFDGFGVGGDGGGRLLAILADSYFVVQLGTRKHPSLSSQTEDAKPPGQGLLCKHFLAVSENMKPQK